MVKITEINPSILDKIKEENGKELNAIIVKTYEKAISYNYELCKHRLDIERIKNRDTSRQRYYIANAVVSTMNQVSIRRDNFIRLLSLLLLISGGTLSYVCYKNTGSVHKGLNTVYVSINDNIMKNSSYYYEIMSLDDTGYITGYIYTVLNCGLKIILTIIDVFKFLIISTVGIFLGITEIGSIALASILFILTVVFTMIMIKFMNSSISIGITGTYIRDERSKVNVGELGVILNEFFKR